MLALINARKAVLPDEHELAQLNEAPRTLQRRVEFETRDDALVDAG